MRRHHMYDRPFGAPEAGVAKPATPHTLRHSFGYDIRTVKDLLGHSDVFTMMLHTHVLKVGGAGVRSPLEALPPLSSER